MVKTRDISLDGYALTAIITTPDTTFVEFSKPGEDDVIQTVTFVDRGPRGLDKGDMVMISQKTEDRKSQCRHEAVNDGIMYNFRKKTKELKNLTEGARADRERVITQMPNSFKSGVCSIFREDCKVSGKFNPPLTIETGVKESLYSQDDLCPSTGGSLKSFDPSKCDQVSGQFEYTREDGQQPLKTGARRQSDMDEELGYINLYGLELQLGQYYQPEDSQAAALDVFYTVTGADASSIKYLHLDLDKTETPASPTQL